MKIGVLTFHWATNYGAVLQAYALCKYLSDLGHEVKIIDYYPTRYKKNVIRAFFTRHIKLIPTRLKDIKKEKQIEKFRINNFDRTKHYSSFCNLEKQTQQFDCYICGSDQIWNMSFLKHGEGKKTYTYFLGFVHDEKIIASYAASFGTEYIPDDLKEDITKLLQRFDFISVRERTGLKIVNELGFYNACIVPDPTILLRRKEYEQFIKHYKKEKNYAFAYILHRREKDAIKIYQYLKKRDIAIVHCNNSGVYEWLTEIYNSKMVITNSFHGIVFSILFEKPFVAILIEGSGMNDRIITLLDEVGLSNRIFNGNIDIINEKINWRNVTEKIDNYRQIGISYIDQILSYKKDIK